MVLRLADLIRWKLDEHRLPHEDPGKVRAGYGSLAPCDACESEIFPAHVEYSFTINHVFYRLHIGCFGLWEAERIRRGWSQRDHERSVRVLLGEHGGACIDCIAQNAGVAVETLVTDLLSIPHHIRVLSTIAPCRRCRRLSLVLGI